MLAAEQAPAAAVPAASSSAAAASGSAGSGAQPAQAQDPLKLPAFEASLVRKIALAVKLLQNYAAGRVHLSGKDEMALHHECFSQGPKKYTEKLTEVLDAYRAKVAERANDLARDGKFVGAPCVFWLPFGVHQKERVLAQTPAISPVLCKPSCHAQKSANGCTPDITIMTYQQYCDEL